MCQVRTDDVYVITKACSLHFCIKYLKSVHENFVSPSALKNLHYNLRHQLVFRNDFLK